MELELKSTFNRIHDTRLVISDLTNQIVITHAAEPTEIPEDHQSIPVESALVPKDALTLRRQGMYWIVADFHPDLRLTVDRKSVTHGTPLPANGVLHVHSNVAGKAIFNLEFRKEVPPAPSNVRRYPIGKKLQIGRAELGRVGLNLNHPTVSRLHAEIISRNNRHQILDCSSEQGVYVNEKRVKRHVLHGGDVIRISAYTFRYKDGALFSLTAPREMNSTESPALQLVKFEQSGRLKSLTFEVYQQELVAILGPSGSGKSTLNESIIYRGGGTGGALFVMNTPIHKSKLGSILGYVPQQEVLHQSLTARECVHYYARLRLPEDTDNEEMRRNVAEALSAVRLTDRNQAGIPHCDTPIAKLSGGQKKRVNIAMELVSKPQIFLLDEPTSGLDPLLDQEFMDLLYRLKTEQKVSILVTTHSTENIAKTCDKVLILAEGGYQAFFGTPHDSFEFFEAKVNDYVAIFKNLVATENNFAPIETLAKRFFGSEYHRPKPAPRSRLGSSNEERLTIEIPSSKAVLQFLVRFAHQLKWQIIRDFHLKRLERPLGFGIIVVLSTLILRIVSFERFDVVANQPGSRIDLQTQAFL